MGAGASAGAGREPETGAARADDVARANVATWERWMGAVPGSWTRREGGVLGVMSGVGLPGFNGVWGESREVDPAAVGRLLDEIRAAGVPHVMQLRPGWGPEVEAVAQARGLVRVDGEPIMVLGDEQKLDAALAVRGLVLRRLRSDEGEVHVSVAVEGGVVGAAAPYRKVTTPAVLAAPGLRCYVGEVDGRAVTTAVGFTTDECVGVFAVATLPEYRRRGYGAAVTARAARDGLDAGARWAWLSASATGVGVYRRIGFAAVEQLDHWELRAS